MGFAIDYGAPGAIMAVLLVMGAAAVVIFLRFMLQATQAAHEDVVEAEEDDRRE